ncbi:MAG TPA: winged helix-turn-helix domain-containing protein [Gammaproteobacteria bacterium]|nr:winged helix-turn-helix domain-containing protein [Gammaproteobacteria bacterium]
MPPTAPREESVIEFGGFRLNALERVLVGADGAPIKLTRRLYDMLLYMVERPGRLLEKSALLDAVWKGAVVEENTLSRTVSTLRQILGDGADGKQFIETVSGVGYRFVEPVSVTASRAPSPATRSAEPSIAVLPFEDLSRERDQAYFADGIAEEILARLADVKGLRLIARSSSFRFRGRAASAQAVGRALSVDYLLAGAVRKDGERVRITAQLVDARSDTQIWSERFERDLVRVFALQDDIARAVAQALRMTLGVGQDDVVEPATSDPEAYDLYLRARAMTTLSGSQAMIRAAELFREAVTRDPNFAAAWLFLAGASRGRLVFAPREHVAGAIRDIEESAARLAEIAPRWWATHLAESWTLHLRRDWLGMERALERALELAPGRPQELDYTIGVLRTNVGDARALDNIRASLRNDPLSLMTSGVAQMILIKLGRYGEADAEYRRSLDLPGDREMVEHLVLHSLWARGEPFREQFRRYLDLTQTKPLPVLDEVYPVCGEPRLALEKLSAAAAAPDYQSAQRQIILAWWLAAFGDVDAAFGSLWRGYVDMRFFNAGWLWFPVLAPVHAHPRFPELFERVGLAGYWRTRKDQPFTLPSR